MTEKEQSAIELAKNYTKIEMALMLIEAFDKLDNLELKIENQERDDAALKIVKEANKLISDLGLDSLNIKIQVDDNEQECNKLKEELSNAYDEIIKLKELVSDYENAQANEFKIWLGDINDYREIKFRVGKLVDYLVDVGNSLEIDNFGQNKHVDNMLKILLEEEK